MSSIKSKIIKKLNLDKQYTHYAILRYLFERFMYRMTRSRYKDNFILRGSNLLYIFRNDARLTKDIDYMGVSISNDPEYLKSVFAEICKIECLEDKVQFNPDTIRIELINKKRHYMGCSVSIDATLEKSREVVKFDIGFDDIITPEAKLYKYPVILEDSPDFYVTGYTIETALAEKIHSIMDKAETTTRMKDFYDIRYIIENFDVDYEILDKAISNTFNHRKTERSNDSIVFVMEYYLDNKRIRNWINFIIKNNLVYVPFVETGQFIIKNVKPLL